MRSARTKVTARCLACAPRTEEYDVIDVDDKRRPVVVVKLDIRNHAGDGHEGVRERERLLEGRRVPGPFYHPPSERGEVKSGDELGPVESQHRWGEFFTTYFGLAPSVSE